MKRLIALTFITTIISLSAFPAEIHLKGNVPERVSYRTFSISGLTVLKNSSDAPLQVILYKKKKGRFPASNPVMNISLKKGKDELVIAHKNYRKIVIIAP